MVTTSVSVSLLEESPEELPEVPAVEEVDEAEVEVSAEVEAVFDPVESLELSEVEEVVSALASFCRISL